MVNWLKNEDFKAFTLVPSDEYCATKHWQLVYNISARIHAWNWYEFFESLILFGLILDNKKQTMKSAISDNQYFFIFFEF